MISIIKSLHRLIGQNGIRLVPSILLSMLDSVLNSCMYGVMLFVLIDLSNGQFSAEGLKMCIIAVVIIFTLRCIVQGISFTQAQCVGPDVSHKLRISMGNHIRSLNLGFFTKNSIGKLAGTLLTDINDFETIITHCLCDVIKVTSLTILSLVIAFMLDWHFGLAVTLLVGIALPLLVISGKVSARNSDELRTANRTVVSRIIEYISGMRTFRLYNLIGKRFDRLDNALKELRKQSTKAEISILPLSMSFSAITAMIVPVSLILGTWLLTSTEINGASFLLAILLGISISSTMTVVSSLYPQVRSISKAADSIISILDESPLTYQEEEIKFTDYAIEFKNVTFGYNPETTVLHGVSFSAKPGTTTALIGPSGSGKTTIVSLLARFWDVTGGQILIDGIDLRKINPDILAEHMAIVFQEVYLLKDTVLNNIRIGKPTATKEEVIEAAKAAHCHEFIMGMENGYETMIGEGGSTLSGGEKQRISIARALLKDAPIVLLDETTSSLDADNEREIQHAFDRLMKNKIVLVIAHRLNTIVNADNILVLDKGRIRESGTHAELMKHGGWYAQMIEEQKQAEQWAVKTE